MASITLRPPTFSKAPQPNEFESPTIAWLSEEWHITHSTLPMWKSKRNVRIQYTPLDPSSPEISKENTDRLDDLVTYQGLGKEKLQTVNGIDTVSSTGGKRGEWDWRGKGWLKIASSHWELLGWGEESQTGNKWMVSMFAKTLFTPAGIDVYSKGRNGLELETLEEVKKALAEIDDPDVRKLAGEVFAITIDEGRMN